MVAEVSISGGVSITANFDGNSIDVSVSIASPVSIIVQLGYGSDPTAIPHNILTGRDAEDAHPIEAISTPVNDNSNIYGWIRSTLLTGLAGFSDAAISAGDSILAAFSKLQGQLNAVKVRLGFLEDKLIYTVTLTAPPVRVTINLDKNGNPFALTECEVHIYMPPSSGDRTHALVINNSEGGNVTSGNNFNTQGFIQYISAYGGYSLHRLKYNADAQQVFCESIGQRYNSATTSASTFFYGFSKNPITRPIHTIELVSASAINWPVGTVISVLKT